MCWFSADHEREAGTIDCELLIVKYSFYEIRVLMILKCNDGI